MEINRDNLKGAARYITGSMPGRLFLGYIALRLLYAGSMAGIENPYSVRVINNSRPQVQASTQFQQAIQSETISNQINSTTQDRILNNHLIPDNLASELISQLNSQRINPMTAANYINAYTNAAEVLSKTLDYQKAGELLNFVNDLNKNLIVELAIEG